MPFKCHIKFTDNGRDFKKCYEYNIIEFILYIFSEKKIWKLMLEHLAEIEEKTKQNLLISHLHQFWYTTVWFQIVMVYSDSVVKTLNYVHVLYTYIAEKFLCWFIFAPIALAVIEIKTKAFYNNIIVNLLNTPPSQTPTPLQKKKTHQKQNKT